MEILDQTLALSTGEMQSASQPQAAIVLPGTCDDRPCLDSRSENTGEGHRWRVVGLHFLHGLGLLGAATTTSLMRTWKESTMSHQRYADSKRRRGLDRHLIEGANPCAARAPLLTAAPLPIP